MEGIIVNPKILGGKPIIQGTRLSVEHIINLLASNISEEEILEDYPHITSEDIHACLKYAARSFSSPSMDEFDTLIEKARVQAREAKLEKTDVASAVSKVRTKN